MGGTPVQACANTTITAPQVGGTISKTTSQAPVNPGGGHTWAVLVTSTAAPLHPSIIDLLPNQLEYVAGSFAFVSTTGGTCPAVTDYTVSVSPNYSGGRDALLITGNPGVTLNAGARCNYSFQTLVKSGAASGTYTGNARNNIYLFDGQNQPFPGGLVDGGDLDHDGSTVDRYTSGGDNFAVAESSAADIVKQVKGDRDATWLDSAEVPGQADQIGSSTWGGTVQWRLKMGNQGNRNLTDLVAYDLLPDPASPGVTDGRYSDTKPYEWVPTMTGPIDTGGAPVTITYSTKVDPCRPEMDATHGSAPFWCGGVVDSSFVPAASVADWSKVKSLRFDFGDHTFAGGDYFTFTWTMDVPVVDPQGVMLENGAETWNKSAVQAARLNGDGSTLPLLPAEAPWVVDVIKIPPTPSVKIVKQDSVGNDADTAATAVNVPPGQPTPLKFTITNDGADALKAVKVTDAVTQGGATVTGLSCDFSGLGGPATGTTWAGPFAVNASFGCTATLSALQPGVDHTDVATVTATGDDSGVDVTDDDPFHATTTPTPAITIVKKDAAGHDANTAGTAVQVGDGDTTPLVFTVTNSGNEDLVGVAVTDAVTQGGGTVSGLTCNFATLGGPATGTTWAGPFHAGDAVTCTATLSALDPGDDHTDVATVDAEGRFSGTAVDDDDPFHAVTPVPSVAIVKKDAAGNDANTVATAVERPTGQTTGLAFTVTNDGEEPLVDITVVDAVTDGDATVTGLSCNFTGVGGPATGTTWAGPLAVGASFPCTATLSALTPGVPHADLATVTGAGQFSGDDVDDDDPYHAQTTAAPAISIEKADEDGNDADTVATAVTVDQGATTDLVFTVANAGNEDLVDVAVADAVTDGTGTVSGLSCDFSALGGPATGLTWAGPFLAGDTFECTAVLSALTPGVPHADLGSVTGEGRYSGTPVDDDDPYHAEVPAAPSVAIVKEDAAGHDANTAATAVTVPKGASTDLAFTITNDGNEPLTDVTVTDAVTAGTGTVSGLTCDFSDLGGPASGTTWAGPFEVDDSFGCTATLGVLVPGELHTDLASVTGTGRYSGDEVADDDPYNALTAPVYAIGDYVWRDLDEDGVQDAGEPPVQGVVVTLTDALGGEVTDADGNVVAPTTTAADGSYHFDVLPAGPYVVTFTAPTGYELTQALAGADAKVDSDANVVTGRSAIVNLGPLDVNLTPSVTADGVEAALIDRTIDAGIIVSGTPGITVEKTDAAGNDADTLATAVTVPKGHTTDLVFTITNSGTEPLVDLVVADVVTEGSGTVTGLACDFSALGGPETGTTWAGPFAPDASFGCTATLSVLVPGELHTDEVTATGAGQYSGIPATDDDPYVASTAPVYAIGDYVWRDLDEDGVQDAGEPPVAGVVVTLTDALGGEVTDADGNVVAPTTTAADGSYHFDVLPAGPYVVTFTAPTGYEFTQALAGADAKVDSDANVVTGRSAIVNLGPLDVNLTPSVTADGVEAALIDRTIDAGIIVSGTPGITVEKTDAAGNDADTVADTAHVPNGETTALVFTITNSGTEPLVSVSVTDAVTVGDATVTGLSCDFSALGGPATGTTWAGPFAPDASFGCTATLSALTPGSSHTDVATVTGAGQYSGTTTTDADPYNTDTPPYVSVGDYVWFDVNRDGLQTLGEPPVAGVTVNLYDAEGDLVATTTTDADGFYSFTGLRSETEYQIGFVAPPGSTFTTRDAGSDDGLDSDVDPTTGRTTVFTTPAIGNNSATTPDDPTWDAGLVQIDLTLTKALDTAGPYATGQTVQFTLVPHNAGPVEALAGWSVTEVVPNGLTLLSLTGDGYQCDLATATCTDSTGTNLGVDVDGAPITVVAAIDADATGTIHNVAYVRPGDDDITETNPLVVPTTSTDTSSSATNNDAQASLALPPVIEPQDANPPGTTNPPAVSSTGAGQGSGNGSGYLPRTGSDPRGPLEVGGLLTFAGLGLVVVARRRKRAAA